ncbi:MAG TPA: SDR family NAD(P)-dependent oxidoreductase [Myxococcota bacterium]|jgi:NAD(P)-dependent dehydrogenase (short-subunit alcohol dehydrogenase family)|nr:SDR family NAD(P)-dependent oxidoreductase [Myxococcota bacterium]
MTLPVAGGRVAVVTGVTSGIGAALARRLRAAGSTVVGLGRDEARLQAAAEAPVAATGTAPAGGFVPVRVDLADAADRARAAAQVARRCARVDVLVNDAAECVYELPSMLEPLRWQRLLDVNFLAGAELVHALLPRMERGGHVVNVSSVTARHLPGARFGPYAVTKAALEEWTRALRLEADPRGIKVTLVAPGLVDTPLYDKVGAFEPARARLREQVPVWLSAEDVADAVMWALARPAHVVVGELVLFPSGQAR